MEEHKNIPQLRFPDFEGEWETKKLCEVGNFIGGGTPPTQSSTFWKGEIPWISSSDLLEDNIFEIKSTRFITSDAVANSATKLVPPNSVLIVSRVGVGKVAVNKVSLCTSQDFTNLIPNSDNFIFLAYLIKQKTNSLLGFNQGTSIKGFVQSDLEALEIHLPTLPEQSSIASFLTAIDRKLTELKQKKSLLEQYKKGVMQKLFSQEMRFKDDDGKEFPKWEKKILGEVFTFRTTNSFSRENLNYKEGTIKNIHYGDIHTKFQTLFDVTKESVPFISPEISIQKISDENYCLEGDIILADASEDLNDIGKSIELINLNKEKVLSGLHTILARPVYGTFQIGFCGYLFKSECVSIQIQKESQGSKVLSISASRLSNIFLSFPCIEEQTKIANFLSAIDEKINHTQIQIQQSEQYKKGLLQQMFC